MNQKFLTISTILRESTLSVHDKENLFHISVKLAKKEFTEQLRSRRKNITKSILKSKFKKTQKESTIK